MERAGAWNGVLKSLLPGATPRSRPAFPALPWPPLPRLECGGAGCVPCLVPSQGATGDGNPDLAALAKPSSLAQG